LFLGLIICRSKFSIYKTGGHRIFDTQSLHLIKLLDNYRATIEPRQCSELNKLSPTFFSLAFNFSYQMFFLLAPPHSYVVWPRCLALPGDLYVLTLMPGHLSYPPAWNLNSGQSIRPWGIKGHYILIIIIVDAVVLVVVSLLLLLFLLCLLLSFPVVVFIILFLIK